MYNHVGSLSEGIRCSEIEESLDRQTDPDMLEPGYLLE